jgi:hypothetical protein
VLGRVLLAAVLVLASSTMGPAASGTPAAPSWSVRYFFTTVIAGGTSFELDATGRYAVSATTLGFPRSERTGTLSAAELAPFARLVAASRTATWSAEYSGQRLCIEHYAGLRLVQVRSGVTDQTAVQWSCGLPGVPADLRALIVALRAQVTALIADAWIDTTPSLEAIPVSTHDAITLLSIDRSRSVSIAADGAIVARRREVVALYPVADCPPRDLGSVDAAVLQKLHVLQTPAAEMSSFTSRETADIFANAMADCPFPPGYGYAAPEHLVPAGTRWVLQLTRAEANANVVSLAVDDAGRTLVRRKDAEAERGTIPAAMLAALDRLVANAHDDRWPRTFDIGGGCEQIVQITHVANDGTRSNGPPIDGGCDAAGAPADAAALFRYAGERLIPELTRPR